MSRFSFGFDALTAFLTQDPILRFSQGAFLSMGFLIIYLLFFALRDILLRTKSFWYQFACILVVAALPLIGFLIYLLIRPARTVRERETDRMIRSLLEHIAPEELPALQADSDDTEPNTPSTPAV